MCGVDGTFHFRLGVLRRRGRDGRDTGLSALSQFPDSCQCLVQDESRSDDRHLQRRLRNRRHDIQPDRRKHNSRPRLACGIFRVRRSYSARSHSADRPASPQPSRRERSSTLRSEGSIGRQPGLSREKRFGNRLFRGSQNAGVLRSHDIRLHHDGSLDTQSLHT